jgi:hypothetical protein
LFFVACIPQTTNKERPLENNRIADGRTAHTLQPVEFRGNPEVPQWVHFPRLHLLLGWGPGLRETLRGSVCGLRHVFLIKPADALHTRPSVNKVIIDYQKYYGRKNLFNGHEPTLNIEGVGETSDFYRLDFSGLYLVKTTCTHGMRHDIVPEADYVVRHECTLSFGPSIILERRTRTLNAEYREKMEELGLTHEHGTGKYNARPDGMRTPEEQLFAKWVSEKKILFINRRTDELYKDGRGRSKRPADFDDRRSAVARSRLGEINRGKRDATGAPKRPLAPEELTLLTCKKIACGEAANMMFDFGTEYFCALNAQGFDLAEK